VDLEQFVHAWTGRGEQVKRSKAERSGSEQRLDEKEEAAGATPSLVEETNQPLPWAT
jgi:hypothetical protein